MRFTGSAGPRRRLRPLIAVAVLAVPAAGAADASAATIAMTQACYVNVDPTTASPIDIVGSGFTPGHTIGVSGLPKPSRTIAGPDGSINLIARGPLLPFVGPGQRTFPLQAQDETTGAGALATTAVTIANFSLAFSPQFAPPSRRVSWSFSGFAPGRTIFVHYRHAGRVVARMAFGTARGPCGTLKARDRVYPGGHPQYGTYGLLFDQLERYTTRRHLSIASTLVFR